MLRQRRRPERWARAVSGPELLSERGARGGAEGGPPSRARGRGAETRRRGCRLDGKLMFTAEYTQRFQGGDRQGCRKAEFYSLMGEEHSITYSQSNGQSGGKSIYFITHYILIYHAINARPFAIFPITVESRRLRTPG